MYEHLTGEGDGWGMVTEDFRYLLRGDMLAHRTVLGNQIEHPNPYGLI